MSDKETAYVLPPEAVSSTDAHTIGGVVGVWTPGEAVAVSDLGMTAKEAEAAFKDTPLKRTTAAPRGMRADEHDPLKDGPPPAGARVRSAEPELLEVDEPSDVPGLSRAELDARKAELADAPSPEQVESSPAPVVNQEPKRADS